jgi:hypothetical protein
MSTEKDTVVEEKYKAWMYSTQEFDKAVVFIASGALGVSFAFIEKLIKFTPHTLHKELLTNSWYHFAIVIFTSMLSHYLSIEANRWAIVNHVEANGDEIKKKKYKKGAMLFNWANRILSIVMCVLLLIGFFHLIGFIQWNL